MKHHNQGLNELYDALYRSIPAIQTHGSEGHCAAQKLGRCHIENTPNMQYLSEYSPN